MHTIEGFGYRQSVRCFCLLPIVDQSSFSFFVLIRQADATEFGSRRATTPLAGTVVGARRLHTTLFVIALRSPGNPFSLYSFPFLYYLVY